MKKEQTNDPIKQMVHDNFKLCCELIMKEGISRPSFVFCKDIIIATIDYLGNEWEEI